MLQRGGAREDLEKLGKARPANSQASPHEPHASELAAPKQQRRTLGLGPQIITFDSSTYFQFLYDLKLLDMTILGS
jgi:hypothetical protein